MCVCIDGVIRTFCVPLPVVGCVIPSLAQNIVVTGGLASTDGFCERLAAAVRARSRTQVTSAGFGSCCLVMREPVRSMHQISVLVMSGELSVLEQDLGQGCCSMHTAPCMLLLRWGCMQLAEPTKLLCHGLVVPCLGPRLPLWL